MPVEGREVEKEGSKRVMRDVTLRVVRRRENTGRKSKRSFMYKTKLSDRKNGN